MIVINGKDESITLKFTFSKTYLFSKEVCSKDESLLTTIPSKVNSNDGLEFLVKLIKHYQTDTKFDDVKIVKILDEYFELTNADQFSLYMDILREFDTSGVFKKGLGKQMAEGLEQTMEQVGNQMSGLSEKTSKMMDNMIDQTQKVGSKD